MVFRNVFRVVLIFVFTVPFSAYEVPGTAAPGDQAEMHAEQGLTLARAGNLDAAEAELRKAVALERENVSFLEDLATVLAMQKKFAESSSYFEQALKIAPNDLTARRYLAANLWQSHRYTEASRNLQILLKASPNDPQGLLLMGMVSENTQDFPTAAKCLSAVPALVRAQPEAIAALATSYYHLGERQKARKWVGELQNHPAGIRAALLGAQIADEMHDYQTAEALLTELASRDPDQDGLQYQLALVKFHEQKFEESSQILQKLVDSGHSTSEVERLLASCLVAENQPDEAIRALNEAIAKDPSEQASYLELADLLLAHKKISDATELAQRMIKAFPDSSRVFISKGAIELRAGNFTDAVTSFRRAAKLDPANAEANLGLARAQANVGMTAQAKATLENAIQHFREKAPFELELGRVLLKEAEAGDKRAEVKAEQLFSSALTHNNKLADAHYELGELALRHGDAAKALVHLKAAAELSPSSANAHFALSTAYRRLGRSQEAANEMALFDKLNEQNAR
jgi:tetratricopeptide (TPR) repeat protein